MPPRMGRPPKGSRTLSKNDVLEKALQLLDEGGSKALTFKALAAALGVTPMAVAHHAGTRDEMIASLVAIAFEGADAPSEAATPKLRLRGLMTRYCAQVTRHPELAKCILENPSLIGPCPDRADAAHRGGNCTAAGVTGAEARTLLCLLVDYTHGFAFAAAAAPRGALSDLTTSHRHWTGCWTVSNKKTRTRFRPAHPLVSFRAADPAAPPVTSISRYPASAGTGPCAQQWHRLPHRGCPRRFRSSGRSAPAGTGASAHRWPTTAPRAAPGR